MHPFDHTSDALLVVQQYDMIIPIFALLQRIIPGTLLGSSSVNTPMDNVKLPGPMLGHLYDMYP